MKNGRGLLVAGGAVAAGEIIAFDKEDAFLLLDEHLLPPSD
jgi:hypothetical protein